MDTNKISGNLSSEDKAAILAAIEAIQAKMPFLKSLTPEERRNILKMGDKSRAFVQKCLEVSKQNPGMLPVSFDLNEYARDVQLTGDLEAIALRLEKLAELVRDGQMLSGSDSYASSLTSYQSARMAGKSGQMDANLDDLAKRFARRIPKATESTKTTAAAM
jgi:hypothetical protein